LWLGTKPLLTEFSKTKKGETYHSLKLTFHNTTDTFEVILDKDKGTWFFNTLDSLSPPNNRLPSFSELKKDFETHFEDFELFWFSKPINQLKNNGLLVL
jgi:hypothetical protein